MVAKKITISFLVLMCFSLVQNISFGAGAEPSQMEKQEYKEERARIKALRRSFKPGQVNNLKEYEKFADEIQRKWSRRNKEYYARLMLEVCAPLSSGNFKDDRRYELARKYALLAVAEPNEISLETELNLIGHAITLMIGHNAPKGEKWAQLRKKDVEIRLDAWKRLMDAIDPNWDPNDKAFRNVAPPTETGLRPGTSPKVIKNQEMRAIYEEAIERNRLKSVRYLEQSRLRDWLKRFPRNAKPYIIQAYSKPPFKLEELKQYLGKYAVDEKTRARILDAVKKNMEKQIQKMKMMKELTVQ